jgi:arylsulfatase A-like enzyme
VVPANAQLTPWPKDLVDWETLSWVEKKLFARQAEVYAAYLAYTDHEIGRVIQAVEDMGKLQQLERRGDAHWNPKRGGAPQRGHDTGQ